MLAFANNVTSHTGLDLDDDGQLDGQRNSNVDVKYYKSVFKLSFDTLSCFMWTPNENGFVQAIKHLTFQLKNEL